MHFEHIDDKRCFRPLIEDVTPPYCEPGAEDYLREKDLRAELHLLFRAHGREGDGEIKCMFISSCLGAWEARPLRDCRSRQAEQQRH